MKEKGKNEDDNLHILEMQTALPRKFRERTILRRASVLPRRVSHSISEGSRRARQRIAEAIARTKFPETEGGWSDDNTPTP